MELACNLGCGNILVLQDNITRGRKPVVALCIAGNRIVAGPLKQWGDAATRVNYADPDDREGTITHAIQLGPVDWGDHGQDVGHPGELGGDAGSAPLNPESFEGATFDAASEAYLKTALDPESFGGDDFGGVGDDCNAAPRIPIDTNSDID